MGGLVAKDFIITAMVKPFVTVPPPCTSLKLVSVGQSLTDLEEVNISTRWIGFLIFQIAPPLLFFFF